MSKPQDFRAVNAQKPVAHVRFKSVEEWQILAGEAERRGVSIASLLRTLALEGVNQNGNQQSDVAAFGALARK